MTSNKQSAARLFSQQTNRTFFVGGLPGEGLLFVLQAGGRRERRGTGGGGGGGIPPSRPSAEHLLDGPGQSGRTEQRLFGQAAFEASFFFFFSLQRVAHNSPKRKERQAEIFVFLHIREEEEEFKV